MRKILLLLALGLAVAACGPKSSDDAEAQAAKALAQRVLGSKARHFVFQTATSPEAGKDWYRLSGKGAKIVVEGNSANSMAVALNHYLKYYCKVEYGWFLGDSFSLPARLPKLPAPVEGTAKVRDRFFLNYCTFGYTMPWWQWADWEHFIDWMALNGVNLPLAITGQESIWFKIWTGMGLDPDEVKAYFTGPSHLPWHRMQNIDRWGGPLPDGWLDRQLELQKQICSRERELNMKPVLPAFAGHVPAELAKVCPDAKLTKLEAWSGYPDEYACTFLDPMDPLYTEIQKKFVALESEIYGTDHIYGIDIFNELTPPSWEPDYLARVSKQVDESLLAADPEAIWLQMGWMFYNDRDKWTDERVHAYLTSFPVEKQLMLDYYCERQEVWRRTDKFHGVPYIWCYLGNFGGNTAMVGQIRRVNQLIDKTFEEGGSNFTGLGATLEGFDCNPFMYEFIFEKAWQVSSWPDGEITDVTDSIPLWTATLAEQRAGGASEEAMEAWKILIDSVYIGRSTPGQSPYLSQRPNIGKSRTYYCNARIEYRNSNLALALEKLLEVNGKNSAYTFDLANVTRQLLANYFGDLKLRYDKAYEQRDRETMKALSDEMLSVMDDIDRVIATHPYFLVGKWIADARSWGSTPEEEDYFESNARNLITTWSDKDQLLNDYAARTLNGLTATFYKVRWEMFFKAIEACLDEGAEWDDAHYNAFCEDVTTFEKSWWTDRTGTFPAKPAGDAKAIAAELYEKYKDKI
ncbi:MAG: alpha-N-acetylglucosaminidase [Bacteroidales bacterium]|nr:alpha-N-acetylglucosaminidase [Bacteroidales bacterium]